MRKSVLNSNNPLTQLRAVIPYHLQGGREGAARRVFDAVTSAYNSAVASGMLPTGSSYRKRIESALVNAESMLKQRRPKAA
jgi:hypothetical protein